MAGELKLAIMNDIGVGMRDGYYPMLFFTVHESESSAALQCLPLYDPTDLRARELLEHVYDVKELEGKPCWVREEGGIVRYEKRWTGK